ncbi:uncharacterized protein C8R40DRAFT_1268265 [Lentinula edodes]|uniref:uncharacterized protein n=1 Tax=Lentinula edodes TaxID=5353 RepID=UPI001E8CE8A9|nr:uncharacterized protein C8R40DRAFT_1268265 [Lentinula edodes]KAH7870117.1 hypothetical protein C8R40DRAFT_1268265 [Lentinula edodes]
MYYPRPLDSNNQIPSDAKSCAQHKGFKRELDAIHGGLHKSPKQDAIGYEIYGSAARRSFLCTMCEEPTVAMVSGLINDYAVLHMNDMAARWEGKVMGRRDRDRGWLEEDGGDNKEKSGLRGRMIGDPGEDNVCGGSKGGGELKRDAMGILRGRMMTM